MLWRLCFDRNHLLRPRHTSLRVPPATPPTSGGVLMPAAGAFIQRAGVTHAMYAVIETGGKQYRVSPGQTVEVELLPAEPGGEVSIERVLLVSTGESTLVGTPTVGGAVVTATVVREGRGDKIIVYKYHNKKR